VAVLDPATAAVAASRAICTEASAENRL